MDCAHLNKVLTRRVVKGGAVQYVYQCTLCGDSMNQPLAHARVMAMTGGVEPPAFDEHARDRFDDMGRSQRVAEKAEFDAWYGQYLRSPEWAVKRQKILVRCKGVCEGCAEARATVVHHLTYEHVGRELLFELVGLCKPCHDIAHDDRPKEA